MENAVDALKVAFAVLIFALAIALTFLLISNIRHTSDVLFEESDTNKYYIDELKGYTYITAGDDDNRTVGAETIIPTIYRYFKENFGVTIFTSDGTSENPIYRPIVRYDVSTESNVSNWDSDKSVILENLNKYVNPYKLNNKSGDVWNEDYIKNIYTVKQNGVEKVYTPYANNDDYKLTRIKFDLYKSTTDSTDFVSNENIGAYTYNGKDLYESIIKDKEFKEYFVFVPREDINQTDKLEIIYVQN